MKMLHCLLLHSGELCQAMQHVQEKLWRCIASYWQLSTSNNIHTATSWSGSGRLATEMLHCIPLKMWKLSSKKIIIFLKRKPVFFMGEKTQLWKKPGWFALSMTTLPATPTTYRETGSCCIEHGSSSHQEYPKGEILSWVQSGTQVVAINYLLGWRAGKPFNWLRYDSVGIQESPGKGTERM